MADLDAEKIIEDIAFAMATAGGKLPERWEQMTGERRQVWRIRARFAYVAVLKAVGR